MNYFDAECRLVCDFLLEEKVLFSGVKCVLKQKFSTSVHSYLLTYLQFSVIKWAKQCPGQSPIDVKSDEAIQI
jgi:hypothetical protein